jgi:hypothetical protein
VADVVVPVPSSVVMVTHGSLFGVVVGSLLSFVGGQSHQTARATTKASTPPAKTSLG